MKSYEYVLIVIASIILTILIFGIIQEARGDKLTYANQMCEYGNLSRDLYCIKLDYKTTWELEAIYSGVSVRQLMNLNRTNKLVKGNWLIVPIRNDNYMLLSPFPRYDAFHMPIKGMGIIVNPKELAWGLYQNAELINWGLTTPGKDSCKKKNGWAKCHSPVGTFKIMDKKGEHYRSTMYPIDCPRSEPCAPMKWAMHIRPAGEALHASDNHPGQPDSHGCLRLLEEDALYLNQVMNIGDKVIVFPY